MGPIGKDSFESNEYINMTVFLHSFFLIMVSMPSLFIVSGYNGFYFFGLTLPVATLLFQIKDLTYVVKIPKKIVLSILILLFSSVINSVSASFMHLALHLLFLLIIISFYNYETNNNNILLTKTIRFIFITYSILVLIVSFLHIIGQLWIVPGFIYLFDDGDIRILIFSTEPSYLSFLIFIMYRYLTYNNQNKLYLLIAVLVMILTKSMFGLVLSVFAIVSYFLLSTKDIKFFSGSLFIFLALLLIVTSIIPEYYLNRIIELLNADGAIDSYGTFSIRILPVIFFYEQVMSNPMILLFGEGSNSMNIEFYNSIGYQYTSNDSLSTHMASFLYDYGIFPSLLVASHIIQHGIKNKILSIILLILISLNSSFGTYLFLFYVLLEQSIKLNSRRGVYA